MTQEIKIYNMNVRGLGDLKKRRKVFNYLKQIDADLFCLQETHSDLNQETLWKKTMEQNLFFTWKY